MGILGGLPPLDGRIAYFRFRHRLAQFRPLGNSKDFWEHRWAETRITERLHAYRTGRLDEFENIFTRYLTKDMPVLEAGCGVGQLVMALSARGYRVEGVDYAEQTIMRVRDAAPELDVRVGDVYNLDVPDGYYGGYISIGIFEHNPDGPLDGLREVQRVLHPRGVAFIAVPYLNSTRRKWLHQVLAVEDEVLSNGLRFYQYYFSKEDFARYLRIAGLQIIEVFPYAVYSGLTRDYMLGRWLHQRGFFIWRLHKRVTRWCRQAPLWIRWRWAHMLMFVCKRV